MYFDRIEEKEVDGKFRVYAINTIDDQAYLLTNTIISTSDSGIEGLRLSISSCAENYIYRGKFQTSEELQKFAKSISKLIHDADVKSNSILFRGKP